MTQPPLVFAIKIESKFRLIAFIKLNKAILESDQKTTRYPLSQKSGDTLFDLGCQLAIFVTCANFGREKNEFL